MKPTTVLAETKSPTGESLTLTEHDGNFFLNVDQHQLMSTTATESEKALAELATRELESHPKPRVLIGGLGFGFTLRAVLEIVRSRAEVEVAELLPEIIRWNREFLQSVNGSLLNDRRVKVRQEDVFDVLKNAGNRKYDSIMLDVDNGPVALVDGSNDRIYDRRGLEIIQDALKPDGLVAFWSARRDPPFEKRLRKYGWELEWVGAKAHSRSKQANHTIYLAHRRK